MLDQNLTFSIKKLQKNRILLLIGGSALILVFVFLLIHLDSKLTSNSSPDDIGFKARTIISNTHSVASQDLDLSLKEIVFTDNFISHSNVPGSFTKALGLKNRTPGDIIKTENGRFWFISTYNSCKNVGYCSQYTYLLDTKERMISEIDIDGVTSSLEILRDSFVILIDYLGNTRRLSLFDMENYVILDEIVEEERQDGILLGEESYEKLITNISLGPDNFYTYTMGDSLYSRNIQNHTSTRLGRFYDTNLLEISHKMNVPATFSTDGNTLYTLLHVNTFPPEERLIKITDRKFIDDPLNLIAWNLKDNTKRIITSQEFNYPFYFRLLPNNTILIGGGRNGFGKLTNQNYIVNIENGDVKLFFNKITNNINIDEEKQTITIISSNNEKDGWAMDQYGSLVVFDFSGKLLSETKGNYN
jgi:hypothetical protein